MGHQALQGLLQPPERPRPQEHCDVLQSSQPTVILATGAVLNILGTALASTARVLVQPSSLKRQIELPQSPHERDTL